MTIVDTSITLDHRQDLVNNNPNKINLPGSIGSNDEITLTFQGDEEAEPLDKAAKFFKEYSSNFCKDELQFGYCEEENMFYCFFDGGQTIKIEPDYAETIIKDYFQSDTDNKKLYDMKYMEILLESAKESQTQKL